MRLRETSTLPKSQLGSMMHRIRLAMKDDSNTKLGGSNKGGPVEVDEAFVGEDPKTGTLTVARRCGRKYVQSASSVTRTPIPTRPR